MSNPIIYGIDPGKQGALAVCRSGEVAEVIRLSGYPDHADALRATLDRYPDPDLVLIEQVTLGSALVRSQTQLVTAAKLLGLPIRVVTPVSWQRAVGAGPTRRDGYRDSEGGRRRKRFLQDHCERLTGRRYTQAECDAVMIALAGCRFLKKST